MLLRNLFARLATAAYYAVGNVRASLIGVRLGAGARVSPRAAVSGVAAIGAAMIGSKARIGPGTYVGSGSIDCGDIGSFCSIGQNVHIGPTEHDMLCWTTSPFLLRMMGEDDAPATRDLPAPKIGSDVWIGTGAIVLRGSVIGDGAVIGAGSVVRGVVPSYEVWAGVPARAIRDRFPDDQSREAAQRKLAEALVALGAATAGRPPKA